MNQQSVEKLYQMRLNTMAGAFSEQVKSASMMELSFEERFAMIVDSEWTFRENRKLKNRLKKAHIKHDAAVEDIDFRHPRGLDRSYLLSIATCQWIKSHQNFIITGPTGIGKSYIADALTNKACREGFTAICYRYPRLLREFELARIDGSYMTLLGKLAKTDLLVIDDFGLAPLSDNERRDLLEIMEDRHNTRSTLITSQYPISDWHSMIGEQTIADAILDRIVHNAHKITLTGESMRKTKSNLTHAEP